MTTWQRPGGLATGPGYLAADLVGRLEAARPALDALLQPRSIAVVGASAETGTLGGLLFANLVASPFPGPVLPVNKKHPVVQGVAAYPDLTSCPVVPDLTVISVPAPAVASVVAEAGDLGVRAACVISAGFAETGTAGAELQAEVVRVAAARGVRLVGPNCTGVLSGEGKWRFNATFGRSTPAPGGTCMVSQSGAFGLGVLELMTARGLGMGGFVSVGNLADIGVSELLWYWGHSSRTHLVLLYLESVPEPTAFIPVAQEVGASMPLVVLKAGRTPAGRRGAASHTAALSSGDVAVDAALHQAGLIRASSVEEVLDLVAVLGSETPPAGRRVAVVTNGGGSGVIAADACESNGLLVPELSEATTKALRSLLPKEASVANPVDMIASATARQYGEVVRAIAASGDVDALIVVFNVPVVASSLEVARELVRARAELAPQVGLVAVFLNRDGPPSILGDAGIPSFRFPENAARALAASAGWQQTRHSRHPRQAPLSQGRDAAVTALVGQARKRAWDGWLANSDAQALLAAFGVAVPKSVLVHNCAQAAAAQLELGGPVVVKLAVAAHKSDIGGVRVGLTSPKDAADAVRAVRSDLENGGMAALAEELLVQEQVTGGQEMIVGMNRDAFLGPVVLVGLGGQLVELLGDTALRLAPLSDLDVDEMVRSLKSYPVLTGYRGAPRLDLGALHEVVKAVSAIAVSCPEIVEMDLNPLFVLKRGALAADVRVRLSPGPISSGTASGLGTVGRQE